MASSSRLKPGDKGRVSMSVDLAGKKGLITKTAQVVTNDPVSPVVTLTVSMQVKDDLHARPQPADKIFEADCRTCHVEQGRGKKGLELFMADCFMCHNAGKSPSITQMSRKPEIYLLGAIRDGLDNTTMPGWTTRTGGPLSDAEIDSLVKAIRNPH
ncbi:MAG: c-type cytochrome [Thermodesulfovibrionales bacterium]